MIKGVVWNLMLAAIPVALAYGFGALMARKGKAGPAVWLIGVPLLIGWLLFLPNTCYLLTEWRHLLFDPQWEGLLDRAHMDRTAMLRTAKWALLFLGYSGVGVLLFTLAIRPIERWLRAAGKPFYWAAPPLFLLTSLGVYLGLIERLNSWDIVQRPLVVWREALLALGSQSLLLSMTVFALLLWGLYEAVDIWVDGVTQRLPWLKGAKAASRSASRKGPAASR